MNRVQAALNEGRCVVALGGRAQDNDAVMMDLRRRSFPAVALGGEPTGPVAALNADTLAPATSQQGGMLVLVEPEASVDGRALSVLADLLKGAPNKPKLFVAARAFNPFGLPMGLRLLKVVHLKERAEDFLGQLDVTPVAVAAAPVEQSEKKSARSSILAPRSTFIDREVELATMAELLGAEGGPIVLTGVAGVGRRWLVEQALAISSLKRVPDLTLGRGVGADTFFARLGYVGWDAEVRGLANALKKGDASPAELVELALQVLKSPAVADMVWVVRGIDRKIDQRDGSFKRMGRLQLLLRAMLTQPLSMRVIFIASRAPSFFREGQGSAMRTLELRGLPGKELHSLFEAWQCPEIPRDRFGPIVDRTFGHPMSARLVAAAVRDGADIDELLSAPKYVKAEQLDDLGPLKRQIKRRVGKLDDEHRKALAVTAHLHEPGTAADLQALGITRNQRLTLLAEGLLEQTPSVEDRRFYVHDLVRDHLEYREVADFEVMETLANHWMEVARKLDGVQNTALVQEANRLYSEARKGASRKTLPYPDLDGIVEAVHGIAGQKAPRVDIAKMRLKEGFRVQANHPELLLAQARVMAVGKAPHEEIEAVFAQAAEHASTPDVFAAEAAYHLDRGSRGKAVAALERGVAAWPEEAGLARKLGDLLMRQGKIDEALATLRTATDLEPMNPEGYGLLGELYVLQGAERFEDASTMLAEASRLDPESPEHRVRQAALLRARAYLDVEQQAALLAEAEGLLKEAINLDKGNPRAQVALAAVMLDLGGDVEQADWLLQKAIKRARTPEAMVQHARVLLRKNDFAEAERELDQATKKQPSLHAAFAAKGELLAAQGQLFVALEAYKTARERSPKEAPERAWYDLQIQRLGSVIEAGGAAAAMRAAEEGPSEEVVAVEPSVRRDPGTTTIRRQRKRGRKGAKAGEAAPTEAAAEDVAEESSDAPEAASEAAPEAEPVEAATGEEAAAEAAVDDGAEESSDAPEAASEAAPEVEPA